MYIIDDQIRLNAVLDRPEGFPKKCPLVIIIHGFTGHSEETHIRGVARTVNELGYASLRVDMYGHGQSDGTFRDHTLFKWMTNAMTVIDYARQLPFVTDLYLCGHSQGGLTTILAAALKHEFLTGIMPLSPATSIPDDVRHGMMLGVPFDPENIPDAIVNPERGWTLGGNYLRAAQMIRVEDAFPRYNGPVLLVHADTDEAVPYRCSVEAQKAYKNAELVTIHNDDHCYDAHLDLVLQAIRGWLPKAGN